MDLAQLQQQQRLLVRQKITAMVNRYVVTTEAPGGGEGEFVALVQQKRLAMKEQVTFYADEDRKQPLFGFRARTVVDLGASYDVTAADGSPIGSFRKDFTRSLLRSTWHLEQELGAGLTAVGKERRLPVALARRVVDLPFLFHFDFAVGDRTVMSVTKKLALRDRYLVTIEEPALDRRLAIAMAVALDVLQSR